jgi:branched-chain amino acid transport system substrate-binding protein
MKKLHKPGDFIFRTCFIDPFQGKVMAKLASTDLGAKQPPYCTTTATIIQKGLQKISKRALKKPEERL